MAKRAALALPPAPCCLPDVAAAGSRPRTCASLPPPGGPSLPLPPPAGAPLYLSPDAYELAPCELRAIAIGEFKFKGCGVVEMGSVVDARLAGRPFPPGQPQGKVRALGRGDAGYAPARVGGVKARHGRGKPCAPPPRQLPAIFVAQHHQPTLRLVLKLALPPLYPGPRSLPSGRANASGPGMGASSRPQPSSSPRYCRACARHTRRALPRPHRALSVVRCRPAAGQAIRTPAALVGCAGSRGGSRLAGRGAAAPPPAGRSGRQVSSCRPARRGRAAAAAASAVVAACGTCAAPCPPSVQMGTAALLRRRRVPR